MRTVNKSAKASGFNEEVTLEETDEKGQHNTAIAMDRSGNRYNLGSFVSRSISKSTSGTTTITTYQERALPTSIEDPNGNQITNVGGITLGVGQLTDSLDRSLASNQTTTSNMDTSNCQSQGTLPISQITTVNFPGVGGSGLTVKLCFANFNLATAFQASGIREGAATNVTLLVTVVLPNFAKWAFRYDTYGSLTYVGFPTGGSINYGWTSTSLCHLGSLTPLSRAVSSRILDPGDGSVPGLAGWTYTWRAQSANGTTSNVNIATDPAQNDTFYTVSPVVANTCSYYETQVQHYTGHPSGGTLLKTEKTQYSGAFFAPDTGGSMAVNVKPTIVTTDLPSGKTSQIKNFYDCDT